MRFKTSIGGTLAVLTGTLIVSQAQAANVTVNFNSPTDINQFLQQNNGNAASALVYNPTGGILDQPGPSAGGAMQTAASGSPDATAVFQGTAINLTGGVSTASILSRVAGNTGSVRAPQVGFVTLSNRSFNGELADTGFIAPRLNSSGLVELQVKPTGGTGNVNTTNLGTVTGFTANQWYQLSVTLTPTDTSTGAYSVTTQVIDMGVDGTTPGSTVLNDANRAVTLAAFSTANQGTMAYSGFRTANGTTPMANFDNFSIDGTLVPVPEPTVLAPLGAALAAGMLRRRRR